MGSKRSLTDDAKHTTFACVGAMAKVVDSGRKGREGVRGEQESRERYFLVSLAELERKGIETPFESEPCQKCPIPIRKC